MAKYIISGGKKLQGVLDLNGAKNSVLPILAATILNAGESIIHNVPKIEDVRVMLDILKYIGCMVKLDESTVIINSKDLNIYEIPECFVRKMRSSIVLIGAIIGRCKETKISYPGGCEIGPRPIDLHLKSLSKMGINISEIHGYIHCKREVINSSEISLDFPSVGATENIMLAAVKGKGLTKIYNAAREPEIVDLQTFLNKMGAKIKGAGTGYIEIEGVDNLYTVEHTIIPDRIAIGTYLIAGAITRGDITINRVIPSHINTIISKLKEVGCDISYKNDSIRLIGSDRIKSIENIKTLPYPGFPTDMQAQMMSLMTIGDGVSVINENIFENRFKHANELIRMGANIAINGNIAIIKGVKNLMGTTVKATDLRGGVSLILAGLVANEITYIEDIYHIDRGYECIEKILKSIGADIERA